MGTLGFAPDPLTGQVAVPHPATVRCLLARLDGDALDAAIGASLSARAARTRKPDTLRPIAVDGETVRGSGTRTTVAISLLAAMARFSPSASSPTTRRSRAAGGGSGEGVEEHTPPAERAEILLEIADVVQERAEEIRSARKPERRSAEHARPGGDALGVGRHPFQRQRGTRGNTAVIKPSEMTPTSTILFVDIANQFLPEGVLSLVLGDSSTGEAMALKRIGIELGGKAPVLVFADSPIRETARDLVEFGYSNSGQDCSAACRVIVEDAA